MSEYTEVRSVTMHARQPSEGERANGIAVGNSSWSNAVYARGGPAAPGPIVRADQQRPSREAGGVEVSGHFSNAVGADLPMPGDGREIIASARKPNGGRALAPSEITGDSIVTVGGLEMRVVEAERMGFLTRDAAGLYRATGATDAHGNVVEAPQSAQETPQGDQIGSPTFPELDERTEALRDEFESGAADAAARVAQQFISEGVASETAINALASRLGKEPVEVREHIATMRAGYEAQAAEVAERYGIPAAQVWQYAREHKPGALKEAMQSQINGGNVSGYAELGRAAMFDYLGKVSTGAVAAEVSAIDGITVQRQGGRTLVTVPGAGQMDLPTAVRAGFVEVVAMK